MRFISCLLLFFLPCSLWAADVFDPGDDSSLDFLYINANAGEAAGGHTALRLGDAVFHYQFFPDETFLLVRDSWDSFRFLYNDLHNRSISIATLPLDDSTLARIRNHFTELLVGQQQFLDELDQAQIKKQSFVRFLEGDFVFTVNSLGFFTPSQTTARDSLLRRRIAAALGDEFLGRSVALAEHLVQDIISRINGGADVAYKQLLEALSLRGALRVLAGDLMLGEEALIPAMEWEESLNAEEVDALQQFSNYLRGSIVGLLQSGRPDRGEALLLQVARYLAVSQSLTTLRLVTLDPFFETVGTVELKDTDIEAGKLEHLQNDLQQQADRRRELFFQIKEHPEISCSLLETSRARAWELSRVSDTYRRVRILVRPVLPAKPAVIALENLRPDRDRLQEMITQMDTTIAALYDKRDAEYAYNLFWRNCATELVRSLNTTFPDPKRGEVALGGWMEADSGLVCIPFLFYNEAVSVFEVSKEQFLPARRLRNLEKLYAEENDLLVWLRESNTLSSTLYEPRIKDTPFLFFTDDSFLLRPVLGLFNVGYATLHGIASVFTLPFDGGDGLNQAGRGIFYSLPELTFGNIRKGSYPLGEDMGSCLSQVKRFAQAEAGPVEEYLPKDKQMGVTD